MDANSFRAAFPAFASETDYADERITFWLTLGEKTLSNRKWILSGFKDHGLGLFVAHNLSLSPLNVKSAPSGVVSGRSIGPLSENYDTQAGSLEKGGHWNRSVYGVQFLQLARMVGTGGRAI